MLITPHTCISNDNIWILHHTPDKGISDFSFLQLINYDSEADTLIAVPSDLWCLFQIYYHGETIDVHVSVTNNSNKNIKNIIVSGKHDASCLCKHAHTLLLDLHEACNLHISPLLHVNKVRPGVNVTLFLHGSSCRPQWIRSPRWCCTPTTATSSVWPSKNPGMCFSTHSAPFILDHSLFTGITG